MNYETKRFAPKATVELKREIAIWRAQNPAVKVVSEHLAYHSYPEISSATLLYARL